MCIHLYSICCLSMSLTIFRPDHMPLACPSRPNIWRRSCQHVALARTCAWWSSPHRNVRRDLDVLQWPRGHWCAQCLPSEWHPPTRWLGDPVQGDARWQYATMVSKKNKWNDILIIHKKQIKWTLLLLWLTKQRLTATIEIRQKHPKTSMIPMCIALLSLRSPSPLSSTVSYSMYLLRVGNASDICPLQEITPCYTLSTLITESLTHIVSMTSYYHIIILPLRANWVEESPRHLHRTSSAMRQNWAKSMMRG